MDLKKEQAKEYLKEAELTLISAEAIFEKAEEENLNLWSKVVKTAYDAIEDTLAAAIAFKDGIIPKEHPAKVSLFISLWKPSQPLISLLFKWLGKRGPAQYVDIEKEKIMVPYKLFTKADALEILEDAKEVLSEIKELVG